MEKSEMVKTLRELAKQLTSLAQSAESGESPDSHTPWPWMIVGLDNGEFDIEGPNEEVICRIPAETRAKEYRANARLIEVAPRLLAILRRVRAQLVRVHGPQVVRAEFGYLTEAIEEATGEW